MELEDFIEVAYAAWQRRYGKPTTEQDKDAFWAGFDAHFAWDKGHAEIIAKALDELEYSILRIEGEWGMNQSIATLRANGDEDVALLDDARAALNLITGS